MFKLLKRTNRRKVLIAGWDCASPEVLFRKRTEGPLGLKDRLPNLSRLIDEGIYGPLSSCIPCITVPAWTSMLASKDPGTLGFYGFRNRADYSYERMTIATANAIQDKRVWDILSEAGKNSVVIGVPQSYPVRPLQGYLISCFLTPSVERQYTHPHELRYEIERVLNGRPYDLDVPEFRTDDKDHLLRQIWEMTEKRCAVVKYLLREKPWDFAIFVEIGLDRIHHGLWKFWDPAHPKYEPDNPYRDAIPRYYEYLDRELGEILGMLDDNTVVMVVSDHGVKAMDGGFAVNEWLRREGLLVLKEEPPVGQLTPFEKVQVDWEKTTAWGEGGYYARIFLNVEGREPKGKIPAHEYEKTREHLKRMIEALPDHEGKPMGSVVFKPEEVYREVRNVAPDLMVYFGNLRWRSVGSLGLPDVYTFENDTGPDDANHDQEGVFILWDPRRNYGGRYVDGLQLMDVAPTVLDIMDVPVPSDMQGRVIPR
ncbi:MAG: alkaline phosphatase family protein [Anaerolineae bacterium]|nr:alkaline phosphatase family protein [Anaerolineae bacterium]